jgi:hypothetical protein
VRLHPILLCALLERCRIIVAANYHLRGRGRCNEECSQAKRIELPLPVGDPTDGPSVPLMRAHHHPDGRVGMIAGENVPE